jgi:hypothetical protein
MVVPEAGRRLEGILILQQLGHQVGGCNALHDLYSEFEGFAAINLPSGFNREFGRLVNQAYFDGRFPVRRTIKE